MRAGGWPLILCNLRIFTLLPIAAIRFHFALCLCVTLCAKRSSFFFRLNKLYLAVAVALWFIFKSTSSFFSIHCSLLLWLASLQLCVLNARLTHRWLHFCKFSFSKWVERRSRKNKRVRRFAYTHVPRASLIIIMIYTLKHRHVLTHSRCTHSFT